MTDRRGDAGGASAPAALYRAHVVPLRGCQARAFIDLGFGVSTEATLTLSAPGARGVRPVRDWLNRHDHVLIQPDQQVKRGRLRAVLVDGGGPPYVYRAASARVVDGDTLDVRAVLGFGVQLDIRVRLAGLNVAEKTTREGVEVAAWVTQWLAGQGDELAVATVKDRREKYGRYLATVSGRPGMPSLNELLLMSGMADPYDGGARP